MARRRMISPDFWSDEKIGRLDFPAQLIFIGMWNFADDEGLIKYTPEFLRSMIFPYKDIPIEDVKKWLSSIVAFDLIFPYTQNHQGYAWIINFRNHQSIDRPQPSKIPCPSTQNSGYYYAIKLRDKGICHLCKNPVADFGNIKEVGCKLGSLDHLIPISKGGSDYPSNLKIACLCCNKSRGNKDLITFVEDSSNNRRTTPEQDKLREDKLREDKEKQQPTAAEAALKDIYKTYKLNVYQILNQFKAALRKKRVTMLGADFIIPDEVILATCAGFKKYDGKIRKEYPWFLKVLGQELTKWWVAKQDKEHENLKTEATIFKGGDIQSIKDILKTMTAKVKVEREAGSGISR